MGVKPSQNERHNYLPMYVCGFSSLNNNLTKDPILNLKKKDFGTRSHMLAYQATALSKRCRKTRPFWPFCIKIGDFVTVPKCTTYAVLNVEFFTLSSRHK